MELHKAVIHELVKEPAKGENNAIPASIIEAEDLLDSADEPTIKLIESIQSLYGTKGNASSQGTFDSNGAYTFPAEFNNYIDSNGEDNDFLKMTMNAMENLVKEAKDENFATGGYIVFAFYSQNGEEFVLGAMVKKRDGITLKNLVPETVQEVDLSKLHQAVKVNLTRYLAVKDAEEADDQDTYAPYLSFISPKLNKNAAGYFMSAFGCTDAIPAKILTESAINAVRDFFSDNQELENYSTEAYDSVVSYLDSTLKREDKSCVLEELNHLVNQLIPIELAEKYTDKFVVFANNEPYCIPERFYTNSSAVTKAKKLNIKGLHGAWSLNVEKRVLGSSVNDDVQFVHRGAESYVTIRNLPEKIIDKLVIALDDRQN
ncbi:nucleoid-associated protein [Paraglaciecola chathamensis]|uniref:Nucleoid-associated protein n=1 Tax=Paraglaciecola chathamensis TaxID=368405 RepID=A0A8H9IFP6_9ALTE|nr:nucleoid-associated protein [Paraglaciecola oceanifecundans]GGZ75263.1 hypothetical protein GCM10011274_36940 [Paraglaciecola oceanifecundans]